MARGGAAEDIGAVAVWAVPAGLVGARIYHVLTDWRRFEARLGNWFDQERFGGPTDRPWGLEIDPDNRPGRFRDVATFHPTFA